MAIALTLPLVLVKAAVARNAPQAGCNAGRRPWIQFVANTESQPTGFEHIVRHVRAELDRKGIGVCFEGRGEPIAIVQLFSTSKDAVEVIVDVRDAITHKRVSRTLDLRSIPPDARPLAIAVGTDELLIASWVEVAVKDEDAELPAEVTDVVSDELAGERSAEAGAAVTFESYDGGQEFIGVDMRGGVWLLERFAATLRLGLRRGFEETSPNGQVRADAWLLGLGIRIAVTAPSRPFGVDVVGRLDALRASYVPEADPGIVARPREATAIIASAGVAPTLQPVSTLRISVDGTLGAPLRSVRATDTGEEVSAIAGLTYALGAEVGLLF